MQFEWDDEKDRANMLKHGIDLKMKTGLRCMIRRIPIQKTDI